MASALLAFLPILLPLQGGAVQGGEFLERFPRYAEVEQYLRGLQARHPRRLEVFSLGKSWEQRDIVAARVSAELDGNSAFSRNGNGSAAQRKPAVLIDAGIHAREWIAPTTALYVVHRLLEDPRQRSLLQDVDVFVVPVLNPDGYEYSHRNRSTRMWRKTMSRRDGSGCVGVDANRNFGYKWMAVGASPYACSSQFAGRAAFSEPETRALRDFILAQRGLLHTYLTLHSYGNYLLYPWGFTTELPANEPLLRCVAERAEAELAKVRGTRFKIGSSTNVLYAAAGGSDDWAMAVGGVRLAYTVELPGARPGPNARPYRFAPPDSEILPVGQETFEAVRVFARHAAGDSLGC